MPQLAAKNGLQIRIQRKISFLHQVSDCPYLSLQSVFGKILEILESENFFQFFIRKSRADYITPHMLIPTFLYHKKVFNIEKNSRLYTTDRSRTGHTGRAITDGPQRTDPSRDD